MKNSVFILFDPMKMAEEFDRVKRTHPKLNEAVVSEILFTESIGLVFTSEQYANTEMHKQRQNGKTCIVVKRQIDDPERLIRSRKMRDGIGV